MAAMHGRALGTALAAEGLLPRHCSLVELSIPPTGAVTIRYTVYVSTDDFPKLARAMLRVADTDLSPCEVLRDHIAILRNLRADAQLIELAERRLAEMETV